MCKFKTEVIGTKIKKKKKKIMRFQDLDFVPKCEFDFLTIEFINNSENRDKYKSILKKFK